MFEGFVLIQINHFNAPLIFILIIKILDFSNVETII